jgi:hypothetical protein
VFVLGTLTFTQAVHFVAADGSDLVAEAGTYAVDTPEDSRIQLSAEGRTPLLLNAEATTHNEEIDSPLAVTVLGEDSDVLHVVLVLPNGQALAATGSLSGTRSRVVSPRMFSPRQFHAAVLAQAPSARDHRRPSGGTPPSGGTSLTPKLAVVPGLTGTMAPPDRPSVVIYEHANFGGRSQTLGVGGYILSDFKEVASSIRVPAGLVALLFEHVDAGGGYGLSVDLLEDRSDLSQVNFNDKLSYVCVFSSPTPQGFIWARASVQNGQFVAGHWERQRASGTPVNSTAVVAPPLPPHPANAPPASCGGAGVQDHRTPPPPPFDLTGSWTADDGGIYYVRQLGSTIWWAGLSADSPQGVNDFQRGLRFANVFRGTIEGNTIKGTWAGVPRGQDLQKGTLTLRIVPIGFPVGNILEKQSETGGFRGKIWNIVIPRNPPPCDNITAASPDIGCKFNRVKKNDDSTLYDNLKPEKDNVVVFGSVTKPLTSAYPGNTGRTYQDFINTWNGGDGDFDGDLHFNMQIDRAKLDAQPNFWNRKDGWLYPSINAINGIQAKLNFSGNTIHPEVIMYGRTNGGGQTLLPGWMEKGANSVLWNGFPIDNVVIDSPTLVRIGGASLSIGTRVRITGVLALDCGHGLSHSCYDNWAPKNNLEIHPVYSIDVLQNFDLPRPTANLTGVWAATDAGTYYVSQVGNTVWWLGLSRDRGLTFANVFQGTIQQRTARGELIIAGDWADIPLGGLRGGGTISLRSDPSASTDSPTAFRKFNVTGGFGAQKWEKLYEPHSGLVGPTFDPRAGVAPSGTMPVERVPLMPRGVEGAPATSAPIGQEDTPTAPK